jgi:DNA-binding NarL/FixJ family response regulator
VLLADDQPDFLSVVTRLLGPQYDVVGTVQDGQAAMDAARAFDPDLLLIDISMPVLNGIEAVRRIRSMALLRAKIVFLTMHDDVDYVQAAVAAGADGYVVKSRLVLDLGMALAAVLAGGQFFPDLDRLAHEVDGQR